MSNLSKKSLILKALYKNTFYPVKIDLNILNTEKLCGFLNGKNTFALLPSDHASHLFSFPRTTKK